MDQRRGDGEEVDAGLPGILHLDVDRPVHRQRAGQQRLRPAPADHLTDAELGDERLANQAVAVRQAAQQALEAAWPAIELDDVPARVRLAGKRLQNGREIAQKREIVLQHDGEGRIRFGKERAPGATMAEEAGDLAFLQRRVVAAAIARRVVHAGDLRVREGLAVDSRHAAESDALPGQFAPGMGEPRRRPVEIDDVNGGIHRAGTAARTRSATCATSPAVRFSADGRLMPWAVTA